ncbi:hypothetical protein QBC45DRAFT_392748 [Copromyces sp. CBS 386.78]|nr:hypothetical protein QBC45DRAFT_392748 [Copromyces sp. CBS 386.78]
MPVAGAGASPAFELRPLFKTAFIPIPFAFPGHFMFPSCALTFADFLMFVWSLKISLQNNSKLIGFEIS